MTTNININVPQQHSWQVAVVKIDQDSKGVWNAAHPTFISPGQVENVAIWDTRRVLIYEVPLDNVDDLLAEQISTVTDSQPTE